MKEPNHRPWSRRRHLLSFHTVCFVSRGAAVDEDALISALSSGNLRGAGELSPKVIILNDESFFINSIFVQTLAATFRMPRSVSVYLQPPILTALIDGIRKSRCWSPRSS